MLRRSLTLILLTMATLPAAASAGVPYVLGNAQNAVPSVSTDYGGNSFHVVWSDPGANVWRYCQVLRTAPGCAVSAVIPNPDASTTGPNAPENAFIVVAVGGTPLRMIMPQYISGRTYEADSIDGGVTWSAARVVNNPKNAGLSIEVGRPIEAPGEIVVPRGNGSGLQISDTSGANTTTQLDGSGQGTTGFDPAVAAVTGGTLGSVDDNDNVFAWFAPSPSPLLTASSWGVSTAITPGNDSALAGNGTTAFLAYDIDPPDSKIGENLEIRQWGPSGFGAPAIIESVPTGQAVLGNDLTVAANGTPGLIYRRTGAGLRFATINAKGKYEYKTVSTSDEDYKYANVAINTVGGGLAVWQRDGAIGAVDLTEVKDPTIPQKSKSKSKNGVTLGLNSPGSCVVAGKKFSVSSGGQGVGKVVKIVYELNGGQTETDKTNPYGVKLTVPASSAPGSVLSISATYHVERKQKPKAFTFANTATVDVCGG